MIRLAHDLDERRAGAIEIDERNVAFVQQLAGVFLHVNAQNAHAENFAAGRERLVELRDLIALRQVGVEVVLAREDRRAVNLATGRQPHADRQLDGLAIEHGQRAGIAETNRTDLRIRRSAERRRTAAENFRARLQTRMDFEADDGFP